jgi:hypothetical protein
MPNSTDYTARNASSKNTIVAEMVAWSQVFEVKGFSRTKGLGVGNRIDSGVCTVAGRQLHIHLSTHRPSCA